jgi:tRNA C32,U32 (ribose-2'-O)-methylase TrmJ
MAEAKGGLSKGCIIALGIVGVFVILAIALAIVCYVYKDEIIELGLSKLTDSVATEIKKDLPEDVTAADVDSLVAEFKQAYKDKKVDQTEIQRLSVMFQEMLKDKEVDQEEGRKFMDEMRKVIEE